MSRKEIYFLVVAVGALLALLLFGLTKDRFLVVTAEGEEILRLPAQPGLNLTIRFIHSVQKTPVEENLRIDENCEGFELLSVRYQSFGVGLPFLAEEGNFRQEGNFFVMDGIKRRFPDLSLRTGLGTELSLIVNRRELKLYEKYPPGARIDLKLVCDFAWRRCFKNFPVQEMGL